MSHVASRWLGLHQSEVIYSGVAEAFFEGAWQVVI